MNIRNWYVLEECEDTYYAVKKRTYNKDIARMWLDCAKTNHPRSVVIYMGTGVSLAHSVWEFDDLHKGEMQK